MKMYNWYNACSIILKDNMKQSIILPGILIILSACNFSDQPKQVRQTDPVKARDSSSRQKNIPAVPAPRLIIPGKSIGKISLNDRAENVRVILGKPDQSNAGMGKAMNTWISKPAPAATDTTSYQTTIYFTRNMGVGDEASLAKQIRVTSPFFATAGHLHTGTSLDSITKQFTNLKQVARYRSQPQQEEVLIYAATDQGIAFEIDHLNRCVAILVHEPGKNASETYSSLHADLRPL